MHELVAEHHLRASVRRVDHDRADTLGPLRQIGPVGLAVHQRREHAEGDARLDLGVGSLG